MKNQIKKSKMMKATVQFVMQKIHQEKLKIKGRL